jgi:hypothetical protein
MILTIHRWNDIFENADTRKRERLKFYHAPSGNESRGYITLVSRFPQAEAMMAFGVFQALCQLSATLGKSTRGSFKNTDGTPMDLQQISCLVRIQECHLSAALEILTDKRVGWMKWEGATDNLPDTCQSHPAFVQGQGQGQGQDPPILRDGEPTIEECETFACERLPAQKQFAASVARQFHAIFSVKDWQTTSNENLLHRGKWKARLLQMLEEEGRKAIGRGGGGKPAVKASHHSNSYGETSHID